MGRPRKASDGEILAAVDRAISRVGPAQLTLAAVAAEVNLTAGALVERFGSKRGLLLAFRARAADEATAHFATARAAHASPLEALRAGLLRMTAEISTTDELANHLALVQLELTDPDFHGYTLDHARTLLAHVRLLLATAADRGELAPCDIDRLARAVFVTYNGALLTWTVLRVGRLEDWLGRELDFLLKPWWRPVKSEIP